MPHIHSGQYNILNIAVTNRLCCVILIDPDERQNAGQKLGYEINRDIPPESYARLVNLLHFFRLYMKSSFPKGDRSIFHES